MLPVDMYFNILGGVVKRPFTTDLTCCVRIMLESLKLAGSSLNDPTQKLEKTSNNKIRDRNSLRAFAQVIF